LFDDGLELDGGTVARDRRLENRVGTTGMPVLAKESTWWLDLPGIHQEIGPYQQERAASGKKNTNFSFFLGKPQENFVLKR
jgi:hypothetical protein